MADPRFQYTLRQYTGPAVPVKGQRPASLLQESAPVQQNYLLSSQGYDQIPQNAGLYASQGGGFHQQMATPLNPGGNASFYQGQPPNVYQAPPENAYQGPNAYQGQPANVYQGQPANPYQGQPANPYQVPPMNASQEQPVLVSFHMQGPSHTPPPVLTSLNPASPQVPGQWGTASAGFPGNSGFMGNSQAGGQFSQQAMQGYGAQAQIPRAYVTTLKPNAGMPMQKPGPMQMQLSQPVKAAVNYAQSWESAKQPTKPVVQVPCNACQRQVPDTDIFPKKCPDPGENVCYDCVYAAYLAKPSPTCPACKREYTENELIDIHQLMLYNPQYAGQAGQNPKKPGAEYRVRCVFGHETHKDTIVPNICPAGCVVCRWHYQQSPVCQCGNALGMHLNGDLNQFARP